MLRDDAEADEPVDGARRRFRTAPQGDAARRVPGGDGSGGALGAAVRGDRAALPEGSGRRRSPPGGAGADAAHPLPAAVVCAVRPGGGRSAVRLGGDATVRGYRPRPGRGAGREHGLAEPLFAAVNEHLKQHGMKLSQGTIVDATIIAAAPSTKNKDEARDPEMHQTKKGQQWYFGMKAHIGVDEATGLVHTVVSTAANVADVSEVANLLHGKERHVFGDAGYIGAEKRVPKRGRKFWIAAKRSVVKAIDDSKLREITEELEHAKASIRAAVEHPFRVLKRQFGYVKVRYKGLAKNDAQVKTLFALVNLWMARGILLQPR